MLAPHELLGVPKTASAAEVKEAYRRLAFKHHPDLANAGNKVQAEQTFKEISLAYAKLSGKTPPSDWQGQTAWAGKPRTPIRFSNGAMAMVLVFPLIMTGIFLSRKFTKFGEDMDSVRPHGILEPPANPFLKDEEKPRQRRRSWSL